MGQLVQKTCIDVAPAGALSTGGLEDQATYGKFDLRVLTNESNRAVTSAPGVSLQ